MSLITLDCSRLLCFLRFKPQAIHKAFALTGRFVDCYYTQGVALGYELLPFQGVLLMSIALGYELLPFQGVLLMSIALGYELLPFQGVLLVSIALGYELLPFQGVLLVYFANLSQVYLNILLRCSLSYAKIDKIFFNSKAFVLFYIESFLNKGNKCHF